MSLQIITVSRYAIVAYGIFMGVLAIILQEIGLNLGWVYLFMVRLPRINNVLIIEKINPILQLARCRHRTSSAQDKQRPSLATHPTLCNPHHCCGNVCIVRTCSGSSVNVLISKQRVQGIIIGSAVFPIYCCLTWKKTSAFAAITGAHCCTACVLAASSTKLEQQNKYPYEFHVVYILVQNSTSASDNRMHLLHRSLGLTQAFEWLQLQSRGCQSIQLCIGTPRPYASKLTAVLHVQVLQQARSLPSSAGW